MKLFRVALLAGMLALVFGAIFGWSNPDDSVRTKTQVKTDAVKVKIPVDLTGNWKSDKPKITAKVQNGTIEVESSTEDGGSVRLWYGTFDNPQDGALGVTSKGMYDPDKIYLSSAETKDFVLHDGQLKFQISIMGVTRIVAMKRA